jgi:hypothetical protein
MASSFPNYPEAMSGCIDACQKCHHSCLEAAQRLLESQPNISGSKLLSALTHCIGMTRLTAEMLLTDSSAHAEACELCKKACLDCAELCKGNPDLEACMKVCLECAHCCQFEADHASV